MYITLKSTIHIQPNLVTIIPYITLEPTFSNNFPLHHIKI